MATTKLLRRAILLVSVIAGLPIVAVGIGFAQPLAFVPAGNIDAGITPTSVRVGDFNRDGKLDLAVANLNSDNVSILLGTGTGSFGPAMNIDAGTNPVSVAVGDFNGDGKLDLAVANSNSSRVSILLGTGTGSFDPAVDFTVGTGPRSVAVGDFNGDGKVDLAVANFNSDNVSILLGTGTGSFGTATNFTVGTNPSGVEVGDFNGDGKLDLAVANSNSSSVSILLGIGTGSFDAAVDFTVGTGPRSVAVGDFNGDGKVDLAVANEFSGSVSIFLGDGTGSFGTAMNSAVGSTPASVTVGDFNGDGKPDLAVANFNDDNVSILLGMGTGIFGAATNFDAADGSFSVAVGDFNGDGKPDLAVTNQGSNNVSILLNTSDFVPVFGGAAHFGPATNVGTGTNPHAVAVGDFNRDGKQDLAAANLNSTNVSILLGAGTGSFAAATNFAAGISPIALAVGDFNGDGKRDLAAANLSGANVSILLGDGMGSFATATNFGVGNNPGSVAAGDFNGNGRQDLVVVNVGSHNVSILLGDGTGSFATATNFTVGSFPRSVAVGDFNRDGKQDLAVANSGSANVSILLGDGNGSFGSPTDLTVGTDPFFVVVGDFDRDGRQDLAVANSGSANVSILLGTGTGSFAAATNFTVGTTPRSVAVGDFNSDGILDLAVGNQGTDNVSILLGDGNGSFGSPTNFFVGTDPYSVAVGDFDGNGKPDLAVANINSNNASILLNIAPPPTLSIDNVSVAEGNTGTVNAVFTVTLSAASAEIVTVDFATADNTALAASDYVTNSGTLTFDPGDLTKTITVLVNGDLLNEPDESYFVNLSNPVNATILDGQGLGTITNDDALPSLSIDDVIVAEGNTGTVNAVFTVTLSAASGQTVTVDFATADGTAAAPSDYVTNSGTLTFNPGDLTKTITVVVNGDTVNETDESYVVNLTSPVNATISDPQGLGTITNDDTTLPTLSIDDVIVAEGNTGTVNAVFTVTLSTASGLTIVVDFATANSTAMAPSDYVTNSGTLTFNPGDLTKTITVVVNGDPLNEADETFFVNLSSPVNATILDGQGLGTITNDDSTLPALSINDVGVTEGNTGTVNAVFTVTLTPASGQTVTVSYSTADNTAEAGSDYAATMGMLTFNPGDTPKPITVVVSGDMVGEFNETFFVNLSLATNAIIADSQGVGTILNDDSDAIDKPDVEYRALVVAPGNSSALVGGVETGGLARGPAFQLFSTSGALQATQFVLNSDFSEVQFVSGNFDGDPAEEVLVGGRETTGPARGPAYQIFDTNGSLLLTKFVLNSDFSGVSFSPLDVGTSGVLVCGRETTGLARGPAYQAIDSLGNLVRTQFALNTDFSMDNSCLGTNLDGVAGDEVIVFGREVSGAARGPALQAFNSNGSLRFTSFVLNNNFTETKFAVGDVSSPGMIVYGSETSGAARGPAFQTFDSNGNLIITPFILNEDFTEVQVFGANTDNTVAGDEIVTGGVETNGLARGPAIQAWDKAGNHLWTRFVLNGDFTEVTYHKIDINNDGIHEIIALGKETQGLARGPVFQLFDGSGNLLLTRFVLNGDFTNLKFFAIDQNGDGDQEIGIGGIETTGAARGPAYQVFESNGNLIQTLFVLNADF